MCSLASAAMTRRVDAPGEERAHGDVGAHVLGHRVAQDLGDLGVHAGLVVDRLLVERRDEVALRRHRLAGGDGEARARLDAADRAVQRERLRHVLQLQVVLQSGRVGRGGRLAEARRQLEQALLLAGERHAVRPGGHVEGLDAERVAGAEEHALVGVPDEEGEHAAQAADRVGTPDVVGGDDGLGVPVGDEPGAVVAGELLAQLEVVVDLAVEDDAIAIARVRQRLVRVLDVDDREPVEPQRDVVVVPHAGLVRSAVAHALEARPHRVGTCRALTARRDQSHQAAHASADTSGSGATAAAPTGGMRSV